MKNLHLIETNKPSVLILRQDRKLFFTGYGGQLGKINGLRKDVPQNIYITNSEEIKKGDWFMSDFNSFPIHNIKELSERGGTLGWKQKDLKNNLKIILTTDQDLIGVQPIDDEFLEWFVKNPSCEWVEVEDTCLEVGVCDCAMNENCLKPGYTIIIPQEEPKQELNLNCFDCNKSLQYCTCMEDTINMKQETLQEVKDLSYYKANAEENYLAVPISVLRYISELEERMYSEEELKSTFKIGFNIGYGSTVQELDLKNEHCDKWFEQFKKT